MLRGPAPAVERDAAFGAARDGDSLSRRAVAGWRQTPHKGIRAAMTSLRPSFGTVAFYAIILTFGGYLTFAGVQGDFGLFRRIQIEADVAQLRAERDRLTAELAEIENRTRRLSDGFLDLDLLDEQAREMLGFTRIDEVVLR